MGKARRAAKKKLPGTAEAHAGGNPSSAAAWPDVASFAANAVSTPAFGSPMFGSPKPFDGEDVVDEPPPTAADVPPETSDTIAPQNNNYGDSDGNHHQHQQRRNSIPMLQPEGQNLKPGENSISSIPVALQQQYATAAAANEGDDDDNGHSYGGGADRNEEEEEKQKQTADHEQSYPSSTGRSYGPQEAYYDDLNDADDYKEEDDDDDEEWAARRSRRSRRRSRDGDYDRDRYRHDSYSNDDAPHHHHDDDESYSDDGDGDQEHNLMDLLNEGISDRAARAYANPHGGAGSDSEAEIDFHDSADLDASIPVGNLASALPPPPPPPPPSSSLQQPPRQNHHSAATAAPATDAASAFGISSRWSQFEDDDQLQQMTLEANTAAVMMQMEKHMAKTEAEGGEQHSHDEQGQSRGWMEKARSVVAKIDGAKEREHLADAEAEARNDKRNDQLQRQPSLKLGDIKKAVPGEEMEVSISDVGGQGSSDRFNYSGRRRYSTSSKGASVDGNRSIMTAMTKDTLDGIDLDAVCFAAAQTFGGVEPSDENDVGPTPPQSSFGGSGSTINNADRYYDDESTLDNRVEPQKQGGC